MNFSPFLVKLVKNEAEAVMLLQLISKNMRMLKDPGYLVIGKKYRLGRLPECSIVINDLSVSRVHAELVARADVVLVKDLDSMNGIRVNGVRVTQAEIKPDQIVVFGNAQFQLVGHDFSDIAEPSTIAPRSEHLESLSDAQQRVFEVLLQGCSEKEVAKKLGISPHTVHAHVRAIYAKYDVRSRSELLAKFVSESRLGQTPKT